MNDAEKMIRRMKSDHKKLLKQYDAAIAEASVGTNTHTRLLEAKSKANAAHRAELVEFGVVPKDLGLQQKTEFHFSSHSSAVPSTRKELHDTLTELAQQHFPQDEQLLKACKGLYLSEQDEAIRAEFEKEFPTCATKN